MDHNAAVIRAGSAQKGSLLGLALLSLAIGAASGLVAALFRLSLEAADRLRELFCLWGYDKNVLGFAVIVVVSASAVACAAWLVRRFSPLAEGSGIPHVEGVLDGSAPPARFSLLPVKFIGGLLSMGSGLALGREGPSVQMGAILAHLVGRAARCSESDCKALLAAGAGAGLATAFNAPMAGAVFVLEELVRLFDTRIAIAALGASTGAIAVARVLLGDEPDFSVVTPPHLALTATPLYIALGVITGFVGVWYNRAILGTLAVANRPAAWPVEWRAAAVGAATAALGWFAPGLIGGGDALTQHALVGSESLALVCVFFVVRFALGPLSYSAGVPGGLFAPMLVLGAQIGLLFGSLCEHWLPSAGVSPTAFAIVGMAAFFTAVVRAPLTGIVLVTEMTLSYTMFLPMLGACFGAMAVPTLLNDEPIYDSLRASASRS